MPADPDFPARPDARPSQPILVVEDDPDITRIVRQYLEHAGHPVITAASGPAALEAVAALPPKLVVLDLMLPGQDGMQVLRELRRYGDLPVIILTALRGEAARIAGLDAGADDYVTKPFSPRELVSRVHAVLRRHTPAPPALARSPLELNPERREARLHGQVLTLTTLEFDLLALLAGHPGRVFARSELIERVWPDPLVGTDRAVDVYIHHLRRKLAADPATASRLRTVRRVGYVFTEDPHD
nr:response regulator transcription factor [Deinobacterium chartae]